MITAFELYWILKLDTFSAAAGIAGLVFFALTVISLIASASVAGDRDEALNKMPKSEWYTRTERARYKKRAKELEKGIKVLIRIAALMFFTSIASFVMFVFIPTTKQMAAIMVVPKIATAENVEAISNEAKSLYELAKDYFRESKCWEEAK